MTAVPAPAAVTLGRRAAARGIDAALLAAVVVPPGAATQFGPGWFAATFVGVGAYFTLADATVGTTLGKWLLGLRVEGPRGGRPTVGEAARREAFTLVGAVPFVGPVLALGAWVGIAVTASRDGAGRGWHDRLAGGTTVSRR